MTDLQQPIDTVARQMVYRAVCRAIEDGTISHEDYPDLSQSMFKQCGLRATEIAYSIRPDPYVHRTTLRYLARADAGKS